MSIASGAQMPQEWGGWSWGSYLVNAEGKKEFLMAGGKITVSVVDGMEGGKLYNFSGSGLMTMLTMNADGTVTYTFKLRSDAKWSDGKAVTPATSCTPGSVWLPPRLPQ